MTSRPVQNLTFLAYIHFRAPQVTLRGQKIVQAMKTQWNARVCPPVSKANTWCSYESWTLYDYDSELPRPPNRLSHELGQEQMRIFARKLEDVESWKWMVLHTWFQKTSQQIGTNKKTNLAFRSIRDSSRSIYWRSDQNRMSNQPAACQGSSQSTSTSCRVQSEL